MKFIEHGKIDMEIILYKTPFLIKKIYWCEENKKIHLGL